MNVTKIKCHNCDSTIKIDFDNLGGTKKYCPYCGKKILVDLDQIEDIILEKSGSELTKRVQMEYEHKERMEKMKSEQFFKVLGGLVLFYFAMMFLLRIFL